MKAQCPTRCGNEVSNSNRTTCDPCWLLLPAQMRHEIRTAWTVYVESPSANMKAAALRKYRQAKTRAIQHLIDRQKVPA